MHTLCYPPTLCFFFLLVCYPLTPSPVSLFLCVLCVGVSVDVLSLNAMVKHCLTLPSSPPTPLPSAYPHLTQQRGEEEGKGGGVIGAVWVIEGVIEATHGHTTPNLHTYQVRHRGTDRGRKGEKMGIGMKGDLVIRGRGGNPNELLCSSPHRNGMMV